VSKQVGALAQLTGNAKLGPGVEKLAEVAGMHQNLGILLGKMMGFCRDLSPNTWGFH